MTTGRTEACAGGVGRTLPVLVLALAFAVAFMFGPAGGPAQAQGGIEDGALGGVLVSYFVEGVEVGACNPDGTRPVTAPHAGITAENATAGMEPLELPAGVELADVQAALDVAAFESDFVRDGTIVAGDVPSGETRDLEPGAYEVATSVANADEVATALNALGLETTVEQDVQFFDVGQPVTVDDCPSGSEGSVDGRQGDDNPCVGVSFAELPAYVPDVGGCVILEGTSRGLVDFLNAPVLDPDTREQIGIVKDLDPDLSSGAFSVTHQEFCAAFPPNEHSVLARGLTIQQYFDQRANAQERTILDPDGDGLACTAEDDAFLAGDAGQPSGQDEPQCINGILDRDGDGRISPIEAAQAGADATQGEDPCSGTDDGQQNDDGAGDPGAGDEAERPFEQTWTGTITQTSEDDATLEYEIKADIIPISDMTEDLLGEVVGEVRYDSVGCSGVWVLEETNDDLVVVEEQITDGTDVCAELVPIILTPQEDGTLECRTGGEYEGVSTGILTLQSGAPDDDASDNDSKNNDDDERLPSEKMADFGITELPDTGGPTLLLPVVGVILGIGILGAVATWMRRA